MAGGMESQIGLKSEATPGTAVVVDTFPPFRSENIKRIPQKLKSQTISNRQLPRSIIDAGYSVAGQVQWELANTDIATLLKHCFGSVATTGTGPYTHTYDLASSDGAAFTLQVGRPASTGTVHPFTYAGCKVSEWEIAANVGEIATFGTSIVGMTETTATALATAVDDATWAPFVFTEASVSLDATSIGTVKSMSLAGNNGIPGDRRRIGSTTSAEPLRDGERTVTGSITMDFDDLVQYNKVVSGADVDVIYTFSNGTESLTLTLVAVYMGDTPEVGGPELLEQSLPFEVYGSPDDDTGFTAVLVNSEASAA